MTRLLILIVVHLMVSSKLNAQKCFDTVYIKGYYVINKIESELSPKVVKTKKGKTLELPIDIHITHSFFPCDSITKKKPLSYWLNHFFDDTEQVFISCEKLTLRDIVQDCSVLDSLKSFQCSFPSLGSNVYYKTTNLNSGDIFEIYYFDARWVKMKINKNSIEASIIPGRIVQTAISKHVEEFNLYYFISFDDFQCNPKIIDPFIIMK